MGARTRGGYCPGVWLPGAAAPGRLGLQFPRGSLHPTGEKLQVSRTHTLEPRLCLLETKPLGL